MSRRAPGRPKNRGRRPPSHAAAPIVPGRPIERVGSAHARARAVVILGPSKSPGGEIVSMTEFQEEPPDTEREPTEVLEVIARAEFPEKLVALGGVYARILAHFGPATYRVLWIGAAGETLAQEVYVRPDPEADLKRFAAEHELREEALDEHQRVAFERERSARDNAVIRAWAQGWIQRFLLEVSRRGSRLGAQAGELLAAVERFLLDHAESFVRVVTVERALFRRRIPGGRQVESVRLRAVRPRVEPVCDPAFVWAQLCGFLPSSDTRTPALRRLG